MTKKDFWRKLENISKEFHNDQVMVSMKVTQILRQAYQEDLWLPCGVHNIAPGMYNQLYSCSGFSTKADGCRWMLCYTSPSAAARDIGLPEQWEELPVRFIIDNALQKRTIGGLLFNRHRVNHLFLIPKQLLDPEKSYVKALKDMADTLPDSFFP